MLWGECWIIFRQIFRQTFFRIALGNKSDSESDDQWKAVTIYLHEPGKFIFFTHGETMPNNLKIDHQALGWVGRVFKNRQIESILSEKTFLQYSL